MHLNGRFRDLWQCINQYWSKAEQAFWINFSTKKKFSTDSTQRSKENSENQKRRNRTGTIRNQTDRKKNSEIKKKLISARSSRSGSEYHLMRLLRRGIAGKTLPIGIPPIESRRERGKTQRNEDLW